MKETINLPEIGSPCSFSYPDEDFNCEGDTSFTSPENHPTIEALLAYQRDYQKDQQLQVQESMNWTQFRIEKHVISETANSVKKEYKEFQAKIAKIAPARRTEAKTYPTLDLYLDHLKNG